MGGQHASRPSHAPTSRYRPTVSWMRAFHMATFVALLISSAIGTAFGMLVFAEAEILNTIFGMDKQHDPSYFKYTVYGAVAKLLGRDGDAVGAVSYTGPAVRVVNYVWVSASAGCPFRGAEMVDVRYANFSCAVESVVRHLGAQGVEIVVWLAQVPPEFRRYHAWATAVEGAPCEEDRYRVNLSSGGGVTIRRLTVDNASRLGRWYHTGATAESLWSMHFSFIADFVRLYVASVVPDGGMYADTDMIVLRPELAQISDAVFMQHRFGAHMINNGIFKLTTTEGARRFVRRMEDDWMRHYGGRHRFGFLSPALMTRVYVNQVLEEGRSSVQVYPNWVAMPHKCSSWEERGGDILAVHLGSTPLEWLRAGNLSRMPWCIRSEICRACPEAVRSFMQRRTGKHLSCEGFVKAYGTPLPREPP